MDIIENKANHTTAFIADEQLIQWQAEKVIAPTIAPGINIYSGSNDSLGAALTFPTTLSYRKKKVKKQYPVKAKDGTVYPDAEAAYNAYKNCFEYGSAKRLELYIRIAVAKFEQYPELVEAIHKRGGIAWLETCEHRTFARTKTLKWWEGKGVTSPMITCLIEAFKRVSR